MPTASGPTPVETAAAIPDVLADNQIARVMWDAGFGADAVFAPLASNQCIVATAIALGESSGRPNATNKNSNGSTDYGLMQINDIHKDILAQGDWRNPLDNAKMGHTIFQQAGGKFTPWSVYNSNKFQLYMARAKAGYDNKDNPNAVVSGATSTIIGGNLPGVTELAELTTFLGKMSNPKVWASVGLVMLGTVMLIVVAFKLVLGSSTVRKAAGVAANVVPGGGIIKNVVKAPIKTAATAVKGAS